MKKKELLEVSLEKEQCVAVALYMWDKYTEYLDKPQFAILPFKNWLKSLLDTNPK